MALKIMDSGDGFPAVLAHPRATDGNRSFASGRFSSKSADGADVQWCSVPQNSVDLLDTTQQVVENGKCQLVENHKTLH